MIDKWIEEFQSTNLGIERAIEQDDALRLKQLDGQAQSLWEKIISFDATSPEERLTTAKFLLENLIGMEERSSVNQQIIEKVLSLIGDRD